MVKLHTKRISSNRSLRIKRKEFTFTAHPLPSGHKSEEALTITVVLRDLLGIAKTLKEVKFLIHNSQVFVNNRKIKKYKQTIGLFDVLTIKGIQKNYRIVLDKQGKLVPIKIKKQEAKLKISKVIKKIKTKNNKIQLTTDDGYNFYDVDAKVNDSLVIEFTDNKFNVKEVIPLNDSIVFIKKGKHKGLTGKVIDKLHKKVLVSLNDTNYETNADSVVAIGKDKPLISIE